MPCGAMSKCLTQFGRFFSPMFTARKRSSSVWGAPGMGPSPPPLPPLPPLPGPGRAGQAYALIPNSGARAVGPSRAISRDTSCFASTTVSSLNCGRLVYRKNKWGICMANGVEALNNMVVKREKSICYFQFKKRPVKMVALQLYE